jgi:energy-converting hydrogenase Eha subunit E
MSCEKPYFSMKFYLFYIGHKRSQFVVKRLCAHIACKNVCVIFLFFIYILKYV